MTKNFKLSSDDIQPMVPDMGGALATDKITVDGNKVDYMVRQPTDREGDTGWIFYGGGETQDYLDNPNNAAIYSVNTICNYDPDIIPFLTYPPGTEVERNARGELKVTTKGVEKPSVVFMYPVDSGRVAITKAWGFDVASRMLRRLDESSLVIWRPGFTIWLNAYSPNDPDVAGRVTAISDGVSRDAFDKQQVSEGGLTKMKYSIVETTDDHAQASLNIFGFTSTDEIHMSVYYDTDEFKPDLDLLWRSLSINDV